jgi:hypothetical protein
VLIILILHFFIKNVLLSQKRETFSPAPECKTNTYKPEGGDMKQTIAPKPANDKPVTQKDIYDTWFGSGNDTTTKETIDNNEDLDKFFTGEIDIKKEIETATKCVIPVRDTALPKSSTCDPNFDKLPQEYLIPKEVKANCNIPQDKKGIMILNEYENENIMNGGKLFMNLEAYDQQDSSFATL